mmetsp:Transcript_26077/g.41861  ORF Transcript_26077/g.41861 Transcript_26077/m.41861 type:complete len:249 (+) Transcript_26077:1958-2704(+)
MEPLLGFSLVFSAITLTGGWGTVRGILCSCCCHCGRCRGCCNRFCRNTGYLYYCFCHLRHLFPRLICCCCCCCHWASRIFGAAFAICIDIQLHPVVTHPSVVNLRFCCIHALPGKSFLRHLLNSRQDTRPLRVPHDGLRSFGLLRKPDTKVIDVCPELCTQILGVPAHPVRKKATPLLEHTVRELGKRMQLSQEHTPDPAPRVNQVIVHLFHVSQRRLFTGVLPVCLDAPSFIARFQSHFNRRAVHVN